MLIIFCHDIFSSMSQTTTYYGYCLLYREEMEKVNVKFHDNYTVSYQHKKILQFVPELSVDKNLRITTPNIPLLVRHFFLNIFFCEN